VVAVLLLAALPASGVPLHMDCVLGNDDPSDTETARLEILFSPRASGPYAVSFVDPDGRLSDRYGSIAANRRRWSVRLGEDRRRTSYFRLRSNRGLPDRVAELWAYNGEGSQFVGRYRVNQGMLTESFALGASGPLTCELRHHQANRLEPAQ